jgi:hypothetical protein
VSDAWIDYTLFRRLAVLVLGVIRIWPPVFVGISDSRLPWILALAVTYGIGVYVMLPCAAELESQATMLVLQDHHRESPLAKVRQTPGLV